MSENNFKIKYTRNVPEILHEVGGAIAISTYLVNRLIFLSSDGKKITQTPKLLKKPMGIACQDQMLAVATLDSVEVFQNSESLAVRFPTNPGKYNSIITPSASYYTGRLDLHDIKINSKGIIYGINTAFSTLCTIGHNYSFKPIWKPDFVSKILPEDRCHLNGLAMLNDKPKLVTVLGKTDTKKGWKDNIDKGGLLIDVETNEVVIDNLPMPHSPRIVDGKLYVLLSAIGGLLIIDLATGKQVAYDMGNFVRGMSVVGKYIFIGTSKIRTNSKSFEKLPVKNKKNEAGIIIFNKETQKIEGKIIYDNTVQEIYDVIHIPFFNNSYMLTKDDEVHSTSIIQKDVGFWSKPPKKPENTSNN